MGGEAQRPALLHTVRGVFRLIGHAQGRSRRLFFWAIAATIVATCADLVSLELLRRAALAFAGGAGGAAASPVMGFAGFLTATLIGSIIRLGAQRLTVMAQFSIAGSLATTAFAKLQQQSYADYIDHGAAEGFAAFERLQIVSSNLIGPFITGFAALITALALLGALAILFSWWVALIGAAGLAILAYARLSERNRDPARGVSRLARARNRLVYEARTAFRDIFLTNGQARMLADFSEVEHAVRARQSQIVMGAQSSRYTLEIGALTVVIAILLLAPAGMAGRLHAIPFLSVLGLAGFRLLPALASIRAAIHLTTQYADVIADASTLLEHALPAPKASSSGLSLKDGIDLRGIAVARQDRTNTLRGLDLHIRKGERVGIVGESGSGKSTLLDLISGLIIPTEGSLSIDGHRLDPSDGAAWRERIGVVSQAPVLLGNTLRDVVTYPDPWASADRKRFEAALRMAGVEAMVAGFPAGLDTEVGEMVTKLSGGQRQRLALAHAMYRARDLLLLDEATGHLDVESEQAVVDSIHGLSREVTVILVTHRPALLACCDRTLILAGGRLEVGRRSEDER